MQMLIARADGYRGVMGSHKRAACSGAVWWMDPPGRGPRVPWSSWVTTPLVGTTCSGCDEVDRGPNGRQVLEFVRNLSVAFPRNVLAMMGSLVRHIQ